ncbi:MAG: ABC transporter substrate-binding protein [Paracoccaceae bacterium]
MLSAFKRFRRAAGALGLALMLCGGQASAEPGVLRVATLKFGTVNWLISTIVENGLDRKEGYRLETLALAGNQATALAFQSGEVDLFVTDWIWSQRRRDKGDDLRFAAYSRSLGAIMTMGGVADLCDLRGKRIGVVGGDFDKSWLAYRALAKRHCGFDLGDEAEALFGAPPLLARQLLTGAVDAVSTYWNWAAKLEAAGATRQIGADEAMAALGIDPPPPLIGFVWDAARTEAAMAAAFLRSVDAAQEILLSSDAEWERLRPDMGAETDAEFTALRDRFREGVADTRWTPAFMESAAALHAMLVEAAGPAFATEGGRLDPAGFAPPADGE